MKTQTWLRLLPGILTLPLIIRAQEVKITFTGQYLEQHRKTDSILIENLTHPADTVLYYPDTVLALRNTLGIPPEKDPGNPDFVLYNPFPNPAEGSSSILLKWNNPSECVITAANTSGNKVFSVNRKLAPGMYKLTVENGPDKLVILTIRSNGSARSVKLFSRQAGPGIPFRLTIGTCPESVQYAPVSGSGFRFYASDSLRFTGYATMDSVTGSDVISFVPDRDDTVIFHILQGMPCPDVPSLYYQEQTYRTVKIGNQCWMKENLNAGIAISYPDTPSDNGITEKYCYGNQPENCNIYGGLYYWNEMMQWPHDTATSIRGICPDGWHLPSDKEWTVLKTYLGGAAYAARYLKTTGTILWLSPNDASNYSGFSAVPGGYCDYTGFGGKKYTAQFWSSYYNLYPPHGPKLWYMFSSSPVFLGSTGTADEARSVRCVKNEK